MSVVVPAYNSGPHIEALVASLLRQSMPASQFEAIFVDDGSTDGTPARLDELAAAYPHLRVLHIENSGWPSRPRNLGIEDARGEYVLFVDDDDWLGDEALERLHDCARTHDADVVVGRMAGHGRGVPRELFRKNRFDATLANSPLIDSLTCHKLFRRGFLVEHGLRFPEGPPRRLEDHRMVVRAYLLSRRTCVLADYTCYHHARRGDAGNVTATRLDPAEYFASLREALDIVDAHTEPGPLRDRLHRRWLRNEMVNRLRGKRMLDAPDDWVAQVAREVQGVIRERFAPGVAAGLPPLQRVVAHLAERGRVADLRRLADWETGIRAAAAVDGVRQVGTTLTVGVSARLEAAGRPVAFAADGDRDLLVLPVDDVDVALRDMTAALRRSRLEVVARRRETQEEVYLPVSSDSRWAAGPAGERHLVHRAVATVDAATLNSGRAEGTWSLKARVTSAGWTEDTGLSLLLRCAADGAAPVVEDERSLWPRVYRAIRRRIARARAGVRAARRTDADWPGHRAR
ncbi:glycosyltransferase family A protein [Micromonospora sp. CPCC 205561]|uniref:glycosyltransferase family A protein n=1 Tax=Micromonospora sp. CPCC 205561 TaxID=3122407 RepID=UPI002FF3C233